jgi:hypothetical protein
MAATRGIKSFGHALHLRAMLQAGGASGVRITRQTAAHLFHQVLNCDAPFELLAIRVLRLLDPQMRAQAIEHPDNLGRPRSVSRSTWRSR